MSEKKYTTEQIAEADRMMKELHKLPPEKRQSVLLWMNAYLDGAVAMENFQKQPDQKQLKEA